MAIVGVGSDICSVDRIENVLSKQGDRFVKRLLTQNEINNAVNLDANFIARRFAAKEAVSKAIGTGIGKQLSFHDFEIVRKGNVPPQVIILKDEFKSLNIHLSISDEKEYAVAFAVAEK